MNDEKPSEPEADDRPFDGAGGPTEQSAEATTSGTTDWPGTPGRKAPKKEQAHWSTQRIVVLVILLAILALVIYLKIIGVV
jgi:hypothetical protein